MIRMLQELGYPLRLAPYDEWRRTLLRTATSNRQHALHSLLTLVPQDHAAADWIDAWARHTFDTRNANAGLADYDLQCPEIDAPFLERMLADGVRRGLFDAPNRIDHAVEALDPAGYLP
jgi:hypothetical protein